MVYCFFVSDLHGVVDRYEKLFQAISSEKPEVVFMGGDLLPNPYLAQQALDFTHQDFINGYLVSQLSKLKVNLGQSYPLILTILGNDDGRFVEAAMLDAATQNVWEYIHFRKREITNYSVYGYAYVPPTPFHLKDWERYDVSRYVDIGSVSPEQGYYSVPVTDYEKRYSTIKSDLDELVGDEEMNNAVFLFHTPPYKTNLDRAALDGKIIDHAHVDVHVGSIAVQRFIKNKQPLLTLHGHVHESARLMGSWQDQIGRTVMLSAAHDGPELALVQFELEKPGQAMRQLF